MSRRALAIAAALVVCSLAILGYAWRRGLEARNDVAPGEALIAEARVSAVEHVANDGSRQFSIVLGVAGGQAVRVRVQFLRRMQIVEPLPEQARDLLRRWVRDRAIEAGRLSGLDRHRAPTLYLDMDIPR